MKNKLIKNPGLIVILEISASLIIIIIGFISYHFHIPFQDLTANPLSQLNAPFYQGILQRIGLIFWGFVLILPLFTYYILKNSNTPGEIKSYLLFSGVFFGYFLIDELLLIHSFIFPKILNLHQLLVLILYAIATVLFLFRFRKTLYTNYFWIFVVAIFFLGLSMIIDIFSYLKVIQVNNRYFLDDGAKFLGIFNLFIYFFLFCKDTILDYSNHYLDKTS